VITMTLPRADITKEVCCVEGTRASTDLLCHAMS
jgi:hypothetical protein